MNKQGMWRLAAGLCVALPMTASFAQGADPSELNDLLGSAPASQQASSTPAAPAAKPDTRNNADTQTETATQPAPSEAETTTSQARVAAHSEGPAPATATSAAAPATAPVPKTTTTASATVKGESAATARPRGTNRLVEEIIVTAEKREENIQDVPLAITAFSAAKLDAQGIKTVEDLPAVTPGLTISNSAGYNVVYLRGVGTDAFLPGADPSVPFYVDGVPLLGTQGSSDSLGRIKRVEVLKGPQGTLFGTSSVGGAINIITPDPSRTFDGGIELGYGNYNAREVQGYVDVPITDNLAATVSVFGRKQTNFTKNDTGPVIGIYSWGGRAKVRWDITDNLSTTFSGNYQQDSSNGGLNFENTRVAPVLGGGGLVLPQDPKANRHVSFDSLSGTRNNSYLVSDTTDWKLPLVEIKAIGSAQRLNAGYVQSDFDKSDLPIVNIFSQRQVSNQYTGELQFLSTPDTPFADRFTWVGGLFYIYSSGWI